MSQQWPSSPHLCACLCDRTYNSQDESAVTVACTPARHMSGRMFTSPTLLRLMVAPEADGCCCEAESQRSNGKQFGVAPPLLRPHCIPNRAIMVECPPPQKQPANPLWRWRVNLGVTGQDGGPNNESALDTRQQPPPLPPPSETRKILQPAPGGGDSIRSLRLGQMLQDVGEVLLNQACVTSRARR